MLFAANLQNKLTRVHIEKLDAGMLMRLILIGSKFLEIRRESAQLPFCCRIVKAFKEIGHVRRPWSIGESHSVRFACHRYDTSFAFVREEIVETNAEYERNTKQGRQSGVEFSALQFRKECRRQSGMPAELDQPHTLAQSQRAQFFADRIRLQPIVDRFCNHRTSSLSKINLINSKSRKREFASTDGLQFTTI